ncbi:hypothetical protein AB0D49_30945 [Streptomyces sp. NPDC048290]|uniref:hypothetical protein n=1 Tax=Streptomyces sp. NPDC048290 TaxID=3155811 RepID=UPI0034322DED
MPSTETTIPPEALELLALPLLESLTPDQARGAVCVWGATENPLTAETAIDLGEQHDGDRHWFPRACRQHTGKHAYRALQDHAPQCDNCIRDAVSCTTGAALRYLMHGWRP